MPRSTRVLINLEYIKANYLLANKWAPNSKNIAVIKANAYGHGIVSVAKYLENIVPAFAVAIFDEGVTLREKGITKNVLILQGIHDADELVYASKHNLWVTIHNQQQLNLLLATQLPKKLSIWLKIDTGMHRIGLSEKEFVAAISSLQYCEWVNTDLVVSSHFSCASEIQNSETERQLKRFNEIIKNADLQPEMQFSLSNSPAIANIPASNLDWNRPGIMLYGLPLFDVAHSSDRLLKAAMTFESEIISIRDISKDDYVGYGQKWRAKRPSKIATVAVGYADGYPRQAKSGTPVLVNGQRAKLTGVVSMDLISIDVTDILEVKIGDRVELWGESLCANEVAGYADTIGYDLIAGVSARVPRVYVN